MTVADDSLEAVVAERLTRAARAAQDLCDVLWEVLHGELSDRARNGPRAQRVADLSERVADISSTVAVLARNAASDEALDGPSPAVEPSALSEPAVAPEPSAVARSTAMYGPAAMSSAVPPRSEAMIVDERAEEESERIAAVEQPAAVEPPVGEQPVGDPRIWPAPTREQAPAVGEQPPRGRPLPWDEPLREEMRVTRRAVDRPSADKPAS
jgi:hypothetical protein